MKKNQAILKIKTGVNGDCCYEGRALNECLKCNNSVHKFIFPGGKTSGSCKYFFKFGKAERYLIEFFDRIPARNEIEIYLRNGNSDYRLTDLKNGRILRHSYSDVYEINNDYSRKLK